MKLRKFAICAIAAISAILSSCDPTTIDWDNLDATIELDKKELAFTADGGEQTVHLYTTRSWKAKDVPEWVIVTPSEGSPVEEGIDITVKVAKNDGYNRSGAIEISGGIISETISITQERPDGEDSGKLSVADFISKADTQKEYILEGTISGVTNSSFIGFDLTDSTGTISIAFPVNFSDFASQLADGGTVTVQGKYKYYTAKGIHEMSNGTILTYVAPKPIDPSEIKQITVKEFLEKADAATNYRLVGKVDTYKAEYCSFNLNDGTGSIAIYSVTDESKSEFGSQIANGGTVTLYGKYAVYKNQAEIKNAVIEKYEAPVIVSTTIEGTVVAVSAKAAVVKTSDAYVYVFADAAPGVAVGDVVTVTGEKETYNGVEQIAKPSITKTSTATPSYPTATVLKGADFDNYNTTCGFVTFTGTLLKSGNYINIEMTGCTRKGSITYPANDYSEFNGKTVDVTGFFVGISGSIYFNVIATEIKLSANQEDHSLKHPVVSTVKWTLGSKAYDNTSSGTSKQTGTFNGTSVDNLLKLGNSSQGGNATFTIPAGTKKIGFYCVGFSADSSKNPAASVTVGSNETMTKSVGRCPASGNAPYNLTLSDDTDYMSFEFAAVAAETSVTVASNARILVIGIVTE